MNNQATNTHGWRGWLKRLVRFIVEIASEVRWRFPRPPFLCKHREPETVKPDHPDVVPWEVRQKEMEGLSRDELRKKYGDKSLELWHKYHESEPPRMIRTLRGALVDYGFQ